VELIHDVGGEKPAGVEASIAVIPIVFAVATDPLGDSLVVSLETGQQRHCTVPTVVWMLQLLFRVRHFLTHLRQCDLQVIDGQ
jgi:ABC-type uncharacterized transport system substrate-binding protein